MKGFKWSLPWMLLLHWLQVSGGGGFLIKNVRLEKCVHASSHEAGKIGLADCKPHSLHHHWSWDAATQAIINWKTRQCLTVPKAQEFALAQLEACGGDGQHQVWVCSRKGHLTLQGQGLHLSTKQGGHKAFLSREKDKFSRWKTAMDEIICAVDLTADPGLSDPVEESVDTSVWVPEDKTITLSEIHTPFIATRTTYAASILEDEPNITTTLPKNEDIILEAGEGMNWKILMLVLSPLAFILGVIILLLNIQHNRKKKQQLSPLKSCQVVHEESLPLPGSPSTSPKTQIIPTSPCPSLKHGEILIEWKDGTITPLFDNMSYQLCQM
ncbi:uncharacterized protein LOC133378456 isoform X2 [Rhineura floridana]|uniref:uncharacterized protein LOC133378456 isoform X2 n=1 Tax=Rhineura floridana TaxID=261503 RepID=UPI002AC869D1|nr:uncharacterized protein LOC133378456 isoform X2 [Rhineura floridana]